MFPRAWLRAVVERLGAAWEGAHAEAQSREEAREEAEAEATADLARLQAQARRRGMRPWNYSRPREEDGTGPTREALDYLVTIHGEKGAARVLRAAQKRRDARR